MQLIPNIYFKNFNNPNPNLPHIIWAHGWGQTHAALLPLASSLLHFANHWLLDLPGFGASDLPSAIWGTNDYSNTIVTWINQNIPINAKKIWVGHSFGGKIGVNLAATHPELINGLFLIAASGIPKQQPLTKQLMIFIKIKIFKLLKLFNNILNNPKYLNWLKTKFGSPDYNHATRPLMREILVKIINENLSNVSINISCPTELIYGELDTDTPVIIGQIFNKLIKNSKLHIIPQQDHNSILSDSTQQVIYLLKTFLDQIIL